MQADMESPPYDYFEAFLTTLQGFSIVATSMSTFYAQNPRVADHTIANLFPFLVPDSTDFVPTGTIKRIPILWRRDPKATQQ